MLVCLRNTLVVLVMLLVCGAPCQTAMCELACGLKAQKPGCHDGAKNQKIRSDVMDMSGAECAHMTGPSKQKTDFSSHDCPDGNCKHPSAWAFEKSGPIDISLPVTYLALVGTVSAPLALNARGLTTTKSPPLPLSSIDPLLISLRV